MYPYVDRIDRMRYSAWMDQFNLIHGLKPPSQHLRVEPPFDHLRKSNEDVDFLRLVWLQVKKWVDDGDVKNRAELKVRMDASKYKVRWQNNWGGPLEQPEIIGPKDRKLRLSGSIYYSPNFGLPDGIPLDLNDKEAVAKHLANLQQTIDERMDFRAFWTIGRLYGKGEQDRLGKRNASERLRKLNAEKLRAMHLENAKKGLNISNLESVVNQWQSVMEPKTPSRESTQINNPTGGIELVNPPGDEDVTSTAATPDTKADPAPGTAITSPASHAGNQLPKTLEKPKIPNNPMEI